MTKWVTLIYEIPNKPSSKRLYVWRKLKKIGAISLQDAIFVLPLSDKTLEQMQWLAAEISDMDGTANVFISSSISAKQNKMIEQLFLDNVYPLYEKIMGELKSAADLPIHELEDAIKPILREFLDVRYYDYLKCPFGVEIESYISDLQRKINEFKYGEDN